MGNEIPMLAAAFAVLMIAASLGTALAVMTVLVLPGFFISYLWKMKSSLRLIFSAPLSMVFMLMPAYCIFRLFNPGYIVVYAFPALFIAGGFMLARKRGLSLDFKLPEISISNMLPFAVVAAAIFMTYPLNSAGLPLTDASSHYFKIWFMEKSVSETGSITGWNEMWYAGYPFLEFYPPMTYFAVFFIDSLNTDSLAATFNHMIILSYILLSVSTCFLARRFFGEFPSLVAGILVAASPRLATNALYSGQFPAVLSLALVPAFVISLLLYMEKKEMKYAIVPGLILSTLFMTHHMAAYFFSFLAVVFFAVSMLFSRADRRKQIFRNAVMTLLVAGGISLFWLLPAFSDIGLSIVGSGESDTLAPDITGLLLTEPDANCMEYICFEAVGFKIFVLSLAGIVALLLSPSIRGNKISMNPGLDNKAALLISFYLLPLIFAMLPLIGLSGLPFVKYFNFERFTFYFIIPLSLTAAAVPAVFKDRNLCIAASLAILLVSGSYMAMTQWRSENWAVETATLGEGFEEMFDVISQLPEGRVMFYGMFKPAMVSAIPANTGKSMISGWYNQGSHNYYEVAGRIEDPTGQSLYGFGESPHLVYSILQKSFTRWIVVNGCDSEGKKAYDSQFSDENRYALLWVDGSGCVAIFTENVTSSFASKVALTGVDSENEGKEKEIIMNSPGGYIATFSREFDDIPREEYDIAIKIAEDMNSAEITERPVRYERNRNSIKVFVSEPGWYIVKETWHPNWRCSGRGIYRSDLGFMLVRADKDFVLDFGPGIYEYAGVMLSIVFLAAAFIIALRRKEDKSPFEKILGL